jgi:serine-type D-Ala-D-Ala carboxypeptidase (penicillin-binding protein 5/6)
MKRIVSLALTVLIAFSLAPFAEAAQNKTKKTPPSDDGSTSTVPEAFPADADPSVVPQVTAGSVIVIDALNGQVLHEVNADAPRPVASTQKLLTALIVAEEGNLDAPLRVEKTDTMAEPSKLYFKAGEVYPRRDLLQILLIHSMNDVARALARDNAGSIEAFATKMNARAAQLGMRNSHFVNPNGLPVPGQYSTARDMSRVAMMAYQNRFLRSIVCQKKMAWRYNDGRVREFGTTNRVLKGYPLCNGMKTGYTEAAGHCLISSASHNGRDVIVVALGDSKNIWLDSYRLLAWGLAK